MSEKTYETRLIKGRANNDYMISLVIEEFEQAIRDGWSLDKSAKGIYNRPVFSRTLVRFPLVRELAVPEKDILDDPKTNKSELLAYATEKGIVVPEELKAPAAIKKFLKEALLVQQGPQVVGLIKALVPSEENPGDSQVSSQTPNPEDVDGSKEQSDAEV